MTITIRQAPSEDFDQLVPLLLQAEHSEMALRWGFHNLVDALYRMDDDAVLVGGATMQWRNAACEIMELAIVPDRHGQGLGRQFVTWLVDEARRRGKKALLVGTANASIGNIAFYQKCGLRMDSVRRDYFRYYSQPLYENGIQIRDMLVFRIDLNG